MLDATAPIEVIVGHGEVHARYRPAHGLAEWWVTLIAGLPPHLDLMTP